jgi:hypothetical protein
LYCPFPVSPPPRTTTIPQETRATPRTAHGTDLGAQFPNPATTPLRQPVSFLLVSGHRSRVRLSWVVSFVRRSELGRQVGSIVILVKIVIWRSRSWIWPRESCALSLSAFLLGVQALICVTHLCFFLSAGHPRRARRRRRADGPRAARDERLATARKSSATEGT